MINFPTFYIHWIKLYFTPFPFQFFCLRDHDTIGRTQISNHKFSKFIPINWQEIIEQLPCTRNVIKYKAISSEKHTEFL